MSQYISVFCCVALAATLAAAMERKGGLLSYGSCPSDNAVCVVIRMRPPKPSTACASLHSPEVCTGHVLMDIAGKCTPPCIILEGEPDRKWAFNVIFPYDPDSKSVPTNAEVVDTAVMPSLQQAFACKTRGGLCQSTTFFAYGATGSGKSYTMGFERDSQGVMQAAVKQVFEELASLKGKGHPMGRNRVWVSFYEIYGKDSTGTKVFDMLRQRKELGQKSKDQARILEEMTWKDVDDYDTFQHEILQGIEGRSIGQTGMNSQSSRSHGVVTVLLSEKDMTKQKYIKTAYHGGVRLSFVDLAGSEPAAAWLDKQKYPEIHCDPSLKLNDDECRKLRYGEGVNINTGLSELAQCIRKAGGEDVVCNSRNDMLTRMMSDLFTKDSKTGRALSFTRMFATLNPSSDPAQLTLTKASLNYAKTVKKIKAEVPTGVKVTEASMDVRQAMQGLLNEIDVLTQGNKDLEEQNVELEQLIQNARAVVDQMAEVDNQHERALDDIQQLEHQVATQEQQYQEIIGRGAQCTADLDTATQEYVHLCTDVVLERPGDPCHATVTDITALQEDTAANCALAAWLADALHVADLSGTSEAINQVEKTSRTLEKTRETEAAAANKKRPSRFRRLFTITSSKKEVQAKSSHQLEQDLSHHKQSLTEAVGKWHGHLQKHTLEWGVKDLGDGTVKIISPVDESEMSAEQFKWRVPLTIRVRGFFHLIQQMTDTIALVVRQIETGSVRPGLFRGYVSNMLDASCRYVMHLLSEMKSNCTSSVLEKVKKECGRKLS